MFSQFPKVELHLHMDCSLSFDFVRKYRKGITFSEYKSEFNIPKNCCSLKDYLDCAQAAIQLMQTYEQVYDATLDVILQLEKDNVLYAELRFAPLQHLQMGMSPNQVVEASLKAISDYKGPVHVNLLLCTLRHFTFEESNQTADLVIQYRNQGVVGLDLAADEVGFSLDAHESAFQKVRDAGIPCTSHAGEARGPESVWETLETLKVHRIGHGIRSTEDANLLIELKNKNIHLEICPSSNLITKVFPEGTNYPVNILRDHKVSFGINTDGRAISNVDLLHEYNWLSKEKEWHPKDFYVCNLQAMQASFAELHVKQAVCEQLEAFYRKFNDA